MTIRVAYSEYLKSPWWRNHVRRQALDRAGYRCDVCRATQGLEVHHVSYENLGREQPEDVLVLCCTCHATEHNKPLRFYEGSDPEHIRAIMVRMRRRWEWEQSQRGKVA